MAAGLKAWGSWAISPFTGAYGSYQEMQAKAAAGTLTQEDHDRFGRACANALFLGLPSACAKIDAKVTVKAAEGDEFLERVRIAVRRRLNGEVSVETELPPRVCYANLPEDCIKEVPLRFDGDSFFNELTDSTGQTIRMELRCPVSQSAIRFPVLMTTLRTDTSGHEHFAARYYDYNYIREFIKRSVDGDRSTNPPTPPRVPIDPVSKIPYEGTIETWKAFLSRGCDVIDRDMQQQIEIHLLSRNAEEPLQRV